jgi:hypothetical protein
MHWQARPCERLDRFARDDLSADGRLNRNFKLLARYNNPRLSATARALVVARSLCTMDESASQQSPLSKKSNLTKSLFW